MSLDTYNRQVGPPKTHSQLVSRCSSFPPFSPVSVRVCAHTKHGRENDAMSRAHGTCIKTTSQTNWMRCHWVPLEASQNSSSLKDSALTPHLFLKKLLNLLCPPPAPPPADPFLAPPNVRTGGGFEAAPLLTDVSVDDDSLT